MSVRKRNPRQDAGRERRKFAARCAAADEPCALCHGARGPIRYDQPRSHLFPLSLAIDEARPVSRWREYGYPSARACACDPSNWQPTHWVCNAVASDKRPMNMRLVQPDRCSGTF